MIVSSGCPSSTDQSTVNDSPPAGKVKPAADRFGREEEVSSQSKLKEVDQLLQSGDVASAEQIVRRLLVTNPDDGRVLRSLVDCLVAKREFQEAIDVIDSVSEMSSVAQEEWSLRAAELAFVAGDDVEGIHRFESLLTENPNSLVMRRQYGRELDRRGFSLDANRQSRRLIRDRPLEFGEIVGLVFPTRAWLSADELDQLDEQALNNLGPMTVASVLRISGNPRRALEALRDCSPYRQQNPAAVALYLRTLATGQMDSELEQMLPEVPRSCHDYLDYWLSAGVLANRKNRAEAIGCYVQAIRLEPGSVDAHYGMVEALEKAGRRDEAGFFKNRLAVLDGIGAAVQKIRRSESFNAVDVISVSERLMGIGRPLESIAWQEMVLLRQRDPAAKIQMSTDFKEQVLAQLPEGIDLNQLLGEVSPDEAQKSDVWLASLKRKERAGQIAAASTSETEWRRRQSSSSTALSTPAFKNVAEKRGVRFRYANAEIPVERYFKIYQAFGGGVACLDFDRDGLMDFYLGQGASDNPRAESNGANGLYRGHGEQFKNVISESKSDDRGYTFGVTSGDWNQDGLADLLIGNLGVNHLLINQGDGSFLLAEHQDALAKETYTSSVAIADVTGDRLPDLIEINYLNDPGIHDPIQFDEGGLPVKLPGPLQFTAAADRVLISRGDGTMDVTSFEGENGPTLGTGLALLVTDLDGHGGNEIFVANDLMANRCWVGPGQANSAERQSRSDDPPAGSADRWIDRALPMGIAYGAAGKPMACMGVAAADFDGNGLVDLHVTNFADEWSNQYMQVSPGTFMDQVVSYRLDRVSQEMLGFGTQAIDFDNDGDSDLLVGNGHIEDRTAAGSLFAMPTQLLVNEGGRFELASVRDDDGYWKANHFSRAMARCDFNRDGLTDVIVTDLKQDCVLLENRTQTQSHWLQVVVVGTDSERDAVGTQLTVATRSGETMQLVATGDGYQSKNESVLFFGLGQDDSIERVSVRWPSGRESIHTDLSVDQRWMIIEGQPSAWSEAVSR